MSFVCISRSPPLPHPPASGCGAARRHSLVPAVTHPHFERACVSSKLRLNSDRGHTAGLALLRIGRSRALLRTDARDNSAFWQNSGGKAWSAHEDPRHLVPVALARGCGWGSACPTCYVSISHQGQGTVARDAGRTTRGARGQCSPCGSSAAEGASASASSSTSSL